MYPRKTLFTESVMNEELSQVSVSMPVAESNAEPCELTQNLVCMHTVIIFR